MKINFLIADEIRSEVTGKQTILGLYPDSTIIVRNAAKIDNTPPKIPRLIERVAILVNISDAPDSKHEYHIKGQFINPSEQPNGNEIDFGKRIIEKGKSYTIVLQSKPFEIKGLGTYYFNLSIDGEVHKLPFNIKDAPSK